MSEYQLRAATLQDLNSLLMLEQNCFTSDRISKRSFRRSIQVEYSVLWVAEDTTSPNLLGYGLIWCHRGTRLARLYSLAVSPSAQGKGVGLRLLTQLEQLAREHGRLYMRLEVAKHNHAAIALYQRNGYRVFGEYDDYYQDHSNALRMQKRIWTAQEGTRLSTAPWYSQTTDFTCGPASLMMAMASLTPDLSCSQALELAIWREATTIFMTSGLGGCHPFGLALAASLRGFNATVWLNTEEPLFVDGVRSEQKKEILTFVHQEFKSKCEAQGVELVYQEISAAQVEAWLSSGFSVLVLISTYRLDGKKAPHWVLITGMDSLCFYLHDPALYEDEKDAIDHQHVPIAREDFARMSRFGANRLRTAVALSRAEKGKFVNQQSE